jgi:hypothetical protein
MLPYQFSYIIILICLLYHIVLPIMSSQLVYVYWLAYMLIALSPFPNKMQEDAHDREKVANTPSTINCVSPMVPKTNEWPYRVQCAVCNKRRTMCYAISRCLVDASIITCSFQNGSNHDNGLTLKKWACSKSYTLTIWITMVGKHKQIMVMNSSKSSHTTSRYNTYWLKNNPRRRDN